MEKNVNNEEVIMIVDCIYILIIILNPIHSLFQLFVQNCIFLFMKLTHIQVLKKNAWR